jgi:hypothetical protein
MWRKFRNSWLDHCPTLFFVDLEFSSYQKDFEFYEICVADVHGTIILNTLVDHGCSTQAMSNSSDHYMHRHCVEKTYGASSDQHPQNAMTMAQVTDRLAEYLTPESLWVEWSQGFCDYFRVLQALKKLGRASMMPPISNVFRLNLAWRFALTSFDVSCRLSVLYRMTGRYGAELSALAHRAEPDVRMMCELAATYFRGTLQPAHRSLITSYMTLKCNERRTKQSPNLQCISRHLTDLGHTDKEVPERSDEDKQVDEDIDAEDTDADAYSDEEGADLTNEEWRMLRAQEPEIQDDNKEDEDYNDHNN